jgi:hypothetical protein
MYGNFMITLYFLFSSHIFKEKIAFDVKGLTITQGRLKAYGLDLNYLSTTVLICLMSFLAACGTILLELNFVKEIVAKESGLLSQLHQWNLWLAIACTVISTTRFQLQKNILREPAY